MKNIIIALIATTTVVFADISVNFFVEYGFEDQNNTDSVFLNVGETALIQLINSGSDGIGAVTAAGGGMFGDDTLLASYTVTATGDYVSDYATGTLGTTEVVGLNGANVFARIYQDSTASVGSLYYDGSIVAAANLDLSAVPAPTPTSYNFGGSSGVTDNSLYSTVIPEPATVGLMGIAAAGLFASRRKVRV